MNRLRYVLFFFICMFSVFCVKAESFQCEYKFEEKGPTYIFEFDITNDSVKITNEAKDIIPTGIMAPQMPEYKYNYNFDSFIDGEIAGYNMNECPILYLATNSDRYCKAYTSSENISICAAYSNTTDYYVYSDSFLREQKDHGCISERNKICLEKIFGSYNYYYTGVLTESDINKNNKLVAICPSYSVISKKIIQNYLNYKNCSGSTCVSYILNADKNINELKSLCRTMLNYRDIIINIEQGNQIQDECISVCLNLEKNINTLKKQYGISTNSGNGKCGFSGKLIIFITNIVKWVKYIIPVIVIVLGILDFIQAIAADKDDGMKKAQGRFVKRLIAAALIFIIPFIIEFVLDKMGFGANGCGIIDL